MSPDRNVIHNMLHIGPMRGPDTPRLPGHSSGGLGDTFVRAFVRAFAWDTARGVFDTFGVAALLIGLAVLAVFMVVRRRRRVGGR